MSGRRNLKGSAALFAVCLTGLAGVGCQNRPAERPAAADRLSPAALGDRPGGTPDAGAIVPADGGGDGGDAAAHGWAGTDWIEGDQYNLRLEDVRNCDPAPAAVANGVAAGPAKGWVGIAVRLRSRSSEYFATARDFALEKAGIILQARHIDPPDLPRCRPLLKPTQLRAQQTLRAFILFEVPPRFRAGDAPLILSYRPTRWGGARRVEVRIPGCLDDCPEPKVRDPRRKPVRSGKKRR